MSCPIKKMVIRCIHCKDVVGPENRGSIFVGREAVRAWPGPDSGGNAGFWFETRAPLRGQPLRFTRYHVPVSNVKFVEWSEPDNYAAARGELNEHLARLEEISELVPEAREVVAKLKGEDSIADLKVVEKAMEAMEDAFTRALEAEKAATGTDD